jgi:hypothetical protein
VSNVFSRVGAELAGIGSFSALLGEIDQEDQINFNRSDLTDSSGKKLTSDYKIGSLYFKGSACGECGLSVKFRAD